MISNAKVNPAVCRRLYLVTFMDQTKARFARHCFDMGVSKIIMLEQLNNLFWICTGLRYNKSLYLAIDGFGRRRCEWGECKKWEMKNFRRE